jgi:hypothetical protein
VGVVEQCDPANVSSASNEPVRTVIPLLGLAPPNERRVAASREQVKVLLTIG